MKSHEVFIHIHQGCFAGTGAIVRLPQCQWSKPDGYVKISQCITTTKHSKAKTLCIFLGIYCIVCNTIWYIRPKEQSTILASYHNIASYLLTSLRRLSTRNKPKKTTSFPITLVPTWQAARRMSDYKDSCIMPLVTYISPIDYTMIFFFFFFFLGGGGVFVFFRFVLFCCCFFCICMCVCVLSYGFLTDSCVLIPILFTIATLAPGQK